MPSPQRNDKAPLSQDLNSKNRQQEYNPDEFEYLEQDYIPHLEIILEQAKARLAELKDLPKNSRC